MANLQVQTRGKVAKLLEQGVPQSEIARQLGITKSTVAYHARRLGNPPDDRFNRRYDWAEVQRYYDAGHTMRECRERFGFSHETWHAARRRGDLVTQSRVLTIDELLASPRNRNHIKQRLVGAGLKQPRCERCGIEEWCGEPLSLCLHHVNGDNQDNRLENLQILCPNCHSQTENFAGRNRRRAAAAAA